MRPDARTGAQGRRLLSISITGVVCLAALMTACQAQPPGANLPESVAIDTTTTSLTTSTTTTAVPPTDAAVAADEAPTPPPVASRYVVPSSEVAPDAKQLAVDIVHDLTNYEANTNHAGRLLVYRTEEGPPIDDVASPLTHPGYWSRGEVVYPQLGGLTADRVSVMVVTRQTIGRGDEPEQTVVRTIDVRLVDDGNGWRFERLASAGGAFESIEHLSRAHEVATDPRIEMPDSARLDILARVVSPVLLDVMSQLADVTPYGVTVLATGHPHNVFETDRQSHHTVGRAVDIHRIGDTLVIDDHEEGSATMEIMRWMLNHPDVRQVGGPWDLDGKGSSRSFTNTVHLDHVHLAVNG